MWITLLRDNQIQLQIKNHYKKICDYEHIAKRLGKTVYQYIFENYFYMKIEQTEIPAFGSYLNATLAIPEYTRGIVIFSCDAESNCNSTYINKVAGVLQQSGLATLLCNLLNIKDGDGNSDKLDLWMHTKRLQAVVEWQVNHKQLSIYKPLLYGVSVGAASAMRVAANLNGRLRAVVSHNGRPDLASDHLSKIYSPTLFIVGEYDFPALRLSLQAMEKLNCSKKLIIVPGASYFFDQNSKVEEIASHASTWFHKFLNVHNNNVYDTSHY